MRWRPPTRWLVAAVTGTALLAGCTGGADDEAEVAAPSPAPAAPTFFTVVDVPPARVHRLVVEGQGRAHSLVRSSAAVWLAEPPTPAAAASLMAESEDVILPLQAYRRITADPHGSDFGLSEPGFVVRITDAGGAEQIVAVGATTFSGAGSYARREGDPDHVYLLVRGTIDALRSVLQGERVHTPRSELERKVLSESVQDRDPEEVTNPWLAQVVEETPR